MYISVFKSELFKPEALYNSASLIPQSLTVLRIILTNLACVPATFPANIIAAELDDTIQAAL